MLEPRMAAILGQLEDLANKLDTEDTGHDYAADLRVIIADRFACGVEVAWTDPAHGHVRTGMYLDAIVDGDDIRARVVPTERIAGDGTLGTLLIPREDLRYSQAVAHG
jgi:hypothetical protein